MNLKKTNFLGFPFDSKSFNEINIYKKDLSDSLNKQIDNILFKKKSRVEDEEEKQNDNEKVKSQTKKVFLKEKLPKIVGTKRSSTKKTRKYIMGHTMNNNLFLMKNYINKSDKIKMGKSTDYRSQLNKTVQKEHNQIYEEESVINKVIANNQLFKRISDFINHQNVSMKDGLLNEIFSMENKLKSITRNVDKVYIDKDKNEKIFTTKVIPSPKINVETKNLFKEIDSYLIARNYKESSPQKNKNSNFQKIHNNNSKLNQLSIDSKDKFHDSDGQYSSTERKNIFRNRLTPYFIKIKDKQQSFYKNPKFRMQTFSSYH